MRLRLLLAALPFVARALPAQEFVDRGVFVIERGSAETGRVEFAIRHSTGSQAHGGLLVVSSTRTPAHEVQIALELSADSEPVSFTETETEQGRLTRRVSAALSGRRFSARASSMEREVARELPVVPPVAILGDDDYLGYQFLPRPDSGRTIAVTVVQARDLTPAQATVRDLGIDSLHLGTRTVAAQHYALRVTGDQSAPVASTDGDPSPERQFWDLDGRLMRVMVPETGLVATRTEGVPR